MAEYKLYFPNLNGFKLRMHSVCIHVLATASVFHAKSQAIWLKYICTLILHYSTWLWTAVIQSHVLVKFLLLNQKTLPRTYAVIRLPLFCANQLIQRWRYLRPCLPYYINAPMGVNSSTPPEKHILDTPTCASCLIIPRKTSSWIFV